MIYAGTRFFAYAAFLHSRNRLLDYYNYIYNWATPECPNCVEIAFRGSVRFLLTREPEHVKAVLTTKFADFGKGERFHEDWSPFLGDSIFTTDGEVWSNNRSLIRPMFIKERVRDLDLFERYADKLISKLPSAGQTVDIMDLFYRMTLDVTTDFLLGATVNSLDKCGRPTSTYTAQLGHNLLTVTQSGKRVCASFF
jgi:cytochrome P450